VSDLLDEIRTAARIDDGRFRRERIDALVEAVKAREEADALFRTVLGWIVEDHPFLVHGYVQGHHALDPIRDLPAFLRAFPTVDYEGWIAKHGEAMDRLAASEPPGAMPLLQSREGMSPVERLLADASEPPGEEGT